MAVRPRRRRADVWRKASETQNMKKRKLICDVLTGIPASKATEGSEGKLRARGSLPQRQRHTLSHTHLKGPYQCIQTAHVTLLLQSFKCFLTLQVHCCMVPKQL